MTDRRKQDFTNRPATVINDKKSVRYSDIEMSIIEKNTMDGFGLQSLGTFMLISGFAENAQNALTNPMMLAGAVVVGIGAALGLDAMGKSGSNTTNWASKIDLR